MALFKCQGQILKSVFVSGTNRIGGVLKATVSPVLSIITYQWYRNSEAIPNATNTTYTITGFDVDKQIHCIATLYGHPVDSNWLEKVPTSDVQIISSDSENRVGSSLKVEYSNILSEVTYQWYRDGSAINSAKNSTYWINGLDVGHVISCKLTTSGYSVFSNGSKTIPEPTCSISGSSVVGSELTCSIENTLSEVTYQWYRGNTAISNANKKKYTITNSDVGYKIKCSINTSGFGVTSNESGVVDYNWKDWKGSMWDDVGTGYRNESKASFTVPNNVVCKRIHCQASVYNHTHDNIEQAMATPEIWVDGSLVARGPTHSCGSGGWAFPTVDAEGTWGPGTVIVVKSGGNAFRRGVQADLYGIQHD